MNVREQDIKKWLCQLLDQTYLNAEAYKHFYIRILPKERKRTIGNYLEVERVIEVSNLLREPAEILLTLLRLLATHVVVVTREQFEEEEAKEKIVKELLTELIKQGKVSPKEQEIMVDTGFLEEEIALYGDLDSWVEELQGTLYCTVVENGFSIKAALRKRGYQWLKSRQAWVKSHKTQEGAETEKALLWTLSSEIEVSVETPITCLFYFDYYIAVKPVERYNETIDSFGYIYENYEFKKKYIKKVAVRYFPRERERLAQLEIPFELVVPKERQIII
ncbi:hypothetical protein [Enterococcus faecalis]|uniref:hypothetical protein n=1 Tax=Enterococcus faecalis TaxID=1351 RepID=UPI0018975189|nr:hypothetical protein [Enterococcus faecalis]